MKKLLGIPLILLGSGLLHSQDLGQRINAYVGSYANTGDFSGCIRLMEKGEITYENCFGYANHSFRIPNEIDTKFKIGSISKQFTAAAVLILEEQGLLNTTDVLSVYFPNFPRVKDITIQQLLTHTSGIRDIYTIPDFNQLSCQKISLSDLTGLLLESDLEFEPGTRYQYSNGGYALLAQLIEKLSETSYQEYLTEHIFKPLGMNSTGHGLVHEVIPKLATGYDPLGYENLKITDYLDPELLKGSGSLYSTIQDLNIWINSLKNTTLLSERAYEKFFSDYGHNYGYGISLYTSYGKTVFGHDGRVNGFIADYLHYLEPDLSVIILGNVQTGVSDFLRRDIAAIVFEEDYTSKAKTVPAAGHGYAYEERILGTYAFGPNFNVHIEIVDNTIMARANEGGYSELVLLEDGRFFNRTLYAYIKFVSDDQGTIQKMVWINNDGASFEGRKE